MVEEQDDTRPTMVPPTDNSEEDVPPNDNSEEVEVEILDEGLEGLMNVVYGFEEARVFFDKGNYRDCVIVLAKVFTTEPEIYRFGWMFGWMLYSNINNYWLATNSLSQEESNVSGISGYTLGTRLPLPRTLSEP
jgi:hypothetical protein